MAWFSLARRNRSRDLADFFTVMLAASRGDEKAVKKVMEALE